jgi:hypothetical protein
MKISVSKATGYKHARTTGRMTQDKSMRNTWKADAGLGGAAIVGMLLPIIIVVLLFGLG